MSKIKTIIKIALFSTLICWVGVSEVYVIPDTSGRPLEVEIKASASKSSGGLDHAWEFMAGSGHAGFYFRPVWSDRILSHLEDVHHNLGIQTVRFHGIFIDEVEVYQGPGEYNFDNVDRVYDAILATGVKPFIELSYMPEELASCDKRGFVRGYKPFICPPSDYDEWGSMMEAFARHLVERYGIEEVRTWHFEVWNEPNLNIFWGGSKKEYFRLYEVTAKAIKSVDPELKVGGPATSGSIFPWIHDMIKFCDDKDLPLDFISTHGYANELIAPMRYEALKAGEFSLPSFGQGYFYNEVRDIRKCMEGSGRPNLPLYLTEWGSSIAYSYDKKYLLWPNDHDLPNDAAFMCGAVKQANGYTDGFSH